MEKLLILNCKYYDVTDVKLIKSFEIIFSNNRNRQKEKLKNIVQIYIFEITNNKIG